MEFTSSEDTLETANTAETTGDVDMVATIPPGAGEEDPGIRSIIRDITELDTTRVWTFVSDETTPKPLDTLDIANIEVPVETATLSLEQPLPGSTRVAGVCSRFLQ